VERSSGAAPPRQPEPLSIAVEEVRGGSVVSLAGELDLSTIPKLEGRLFRELDSNVAVVIDLSRLSFIDSSGIGLLIRAFRANEEKPHLHTVIAQGSQVDRVFRLAGIDRALPLYLNRDEAVAALNGRAG
jgi:anti-sigma B factor antagonist